MDTARLVPGTLTPISGFAERLGISVAQVSYAYNFPFAESFAIVTFNVVNISEAPWDSVYIGLYHDLVVRNVNTVTETGSAFFNKGGLGYLDSLQTTYAFNAGGPEQSINTYGAISFLGATWRNPQTGQTRFFHPNVADEYAADGLPRPQVNPRWWIFGGVTRRLLADGRRYLDCYNNVPVVGHAHPRVADAVVKLRKQLQPSDGIDRRRDRFSDLQRLVEPPQLEQHGPLHQVAIP